MRSRRLLAPAPRGDPFWVRLYVQAIGVQWAAMLVGDNAPPPRPGHLEGITFFADSAEAAERQAVSFLGKSAPPN